MKNPFEQLNEAAADRTINDLEDLMKRTGLAPNLKNEKIRIKKASKELSPEWAMWLIDLGELINNPNTNKEQVEELIERLKQI